MILANSHIVITCPLLKNLKNGTIVYSSEQESRFDIGTVATYICDQGYVLNGTTLRACMEDDRIDTVGEWSRDAPTCLGECIIGRNKIVLHSNY